MQLSRLLPSNFKGLYYRLADNWFDILNPEDYKNKPITYLEIGTFFGGNLISFANSYGCHNESKLFCIDPWEDYDEYTEYKRLQPAIYMSFCHNILASNIKDKVFALRGFSHSILHKLEDNYFDIIYIDGNHEPEYVLEDAVLSFRKLKKGGIMIFDDYGWGGPDLTQKGIDAFLKGYSNRIEMVAKKESTGTINEYQVFIKKLY